MKKISNIRELKFEQQKLEAEKLALEEIIQDDWAELKDSLTPNNITRQVFSAVFSKPKPGESKSMLAYLASFATAGLAGKLMAKLTRKITGWFSK